MRDVPPSERPRERLLSQGPQALSDAELLALVVGATTRGSGGVLQTCRRLLADLGGLRSLERCCAGELMRTPGIGPARACALMAVVELGRRQWGHPLERGDQFTTSTQVYQHLRTRLAGLAQEVFLVLALDSRNRLLSTTQVAQGTVNSVEVHPRDVFTPLLREAATAGIVAHNHPSGDPDPSEDDRQLTDRLVRSARVVGIPLLDHLIVGRDSYTSFADHGWL